MKKLLLVLTVLSLVGCISDPSAVEVSNANYGAMPNKASLEADIKAYQEGRLKDPYSAKYNFSELHKGWCKFGGRVNYGWIVDYTLNAKNGFGGYVGEKPQFVFVKDGRMYHPEYFLRGNCSK